MHQRQSVIQKVVLTNSEGYWSGEYLLRAVSLQLNSLLCADGIAHLKLSTLILTLRLFGKSTLLLAWLPQ